ncbi:hypothetical protein BWD42_12290 [Sphingobacterium sp. CZ-UAM]|nr:hypothetical protein BWD42_12290 [Sphingobacterium sp. CZ-UAM]
MRDTKLRQAIADTGDLFENPIFLAIMITKKWDFLVIVFHLSPDQRLIQWLKCLKDHKVCYCGTTFVMAELYKVYVISY